MRWPCKVGVNSDRMKFIVIQMHQQESRNSGERNKYVKIPIKTKIAFFRKVLKEHMSIKDSAAMFSINYSTAKTLMRQYKFNMLPYDFSKAKEESPVPATHCSYRVVEGDQPKREELSMEYPSFQLQGASKPRKSTSEGVIKDHELPSFGNHKIEIISSVLFN